MLRKDREAIPGSSRLPVPSRRGSCARPAQSPFLMRADQRLYLFTRWRDLFSYGQVRTAPLTALPYAMCVSSATRASRSARLRCNIARARSFSALASPPNRGTASPWAEAGSVKGPCCRITARVFGARGIGRSLRSKPGWFAMPPSMAYSSAALGMIF